MKKGSSARGFTLIEMLVAMAIFSTLIVVLMMGYHQGLMMWDKGQHMSRRWLDLEFRYRLLDTMFAQAEVADDACSPQVFAPYFYADAHHMRFISSAAVMGVPGQPRPVMLATIRDGAMGWSLRYREGARYGDQGRGIRWSKHWVPLLENLKDISFAFEAPEFHAPEGVNAAWLSKEEKQLYRDKPVWMHSYDTCRLRLYPRRVKISFTDDYGSLHQWSFSPPQGSDAWPMPHQNLE